MSFSLEISEKPFALRVPSDSFLFFLLLSIGLDNYMLFFLSVYVNETSYQFPPKPSTKSMKIGSTQNQHHADMKQRSSLFHFSGKPKVLKRGQFHDLVKQ